MPGGLDDLVALTDALYQVEQVRIQELVKRENQLCQALADLETHRHKNLARQDTNMDGIRQIGADLLWQGWVGRNKEQLNIELAQVLAQKGSLTKALRRAFGRNSATIELQKNAELEDRLETARTSEQNIGEMQLFKFLSGQKP